MSSSYNTFYSKLQAFSGMIAHKKAKYHHSVGFAGTKRGGHEPPRRPARSAAIAETESTHTPMYLDTSDRAASMRSVPRISILPFGKTVITCRPS